MIYILILTATLTGGVAITTQEFSSKMACGLALDTVVAASRKSSTFWPYVEGVCVAKDFP